MDYYKALEYAAAKHRGQKRIGGDEYISHPVAVSNILKDLGYPIEFQVTGLFHDLLEDTDAQREELLGLSSEEVLEAVVLLTKEEGYDMDRYIGGIEANEMARAVKLADRLHNLICAVYAETKFKRKYIGETQKYYIALAAGTSFETPIMKALEELKDSVAKDQV